MKVCKNRYCEHEGEPQSLENFHKNKLTKDGLAIYCRDCTSITNRVSRNKLTQEKIDEYNRTRRLKYDAQKLDKEWREKRNKRRRELARIKYQKKHSGDTK